MTRTRNLARAAVAMLAAAGMTAASIALTSRAASADGHPPFVCDVSTVFVAQGDPTQLNALRYGDGASTFEPIGPSWRPPYNAIAYSPVDNYLYASQGRDGHILQIGAGGHVVDLGPTSPPVPAVNTGAIDQDGTYYLMSSGGPTLWRVDLATMTSTAMQLTGGGPFPADFSIVEGKLWGDAGDHLIRIDPVSGEAVHFVQDAVPPRVLSGAAWTYGNGNLGVSDNVTGDVFQVEITEPNSAAPTFRLVATSPGPASGLNDGTSCTGLPADLGVTKASPERVAPGGEVIWTLVVHNFGPGVSSGYTVTDQVPAGVTDLSTTTPGCSFSGNTLTCVGGVLGVGEEDVITYSGVAPDDQGAALVNHATVSGNEVDPDPGNNQASSTSTTKQIVGLCRGTGLGALGNRLGSANDPEAPCRTDDTAVVRARVGGTLSPFVAATAIDGHTQSTPTSAAAQANLATAAINLPGVSIVAEGLHSEALSSLAHGCAPASASGSSRIASLTINGRSVVVSDQPVDIPLAVGTVHLNQQVVSGDLILQRAIFVDLPGTNLDVVVAESKAAMSCV